MEGPRKQRSVYSVEVQRGGPDGWHSQRISPDWVHAFHAADAAVQAFDRYMDDSGENVASLAPSGANGLQILVWPQGTTARPSVFPLQSVMEHRVRRDVGRRKEAQTRLEQATDALRSSVREAATAGVRQAHLARISGWSRETLRKLARDA